MVSSIAPGASMIWQSRLGDLFPYLGHMFDAVGFGGGEFRCRRDGCQCCLVVEPQLGQAVEDELATAVATEQGVRLYVASQPGNSGHDRSMILEPVLLEVLDGHSRRSFHQFGDLDHRSALESREATKTRVRTVSS